MVLCTAKPAWSPLADPHLPDQEVLRRSGFPSLASLTSVSSGSVPLPSGTYFRPPSNFPGWL
eukprot:10089241-Prorocentrum_lima.AAC.1